MRVVLACACVCERRMLLVVVSSKALEGYKRVVLSFFVVIVAASFARPCALCV